MFLFSDIKKNKYKFYQIIVGFFLQIVELSLRLIVMWSVPFNLNLYDTHMGLAMIYNQGPFTSSSYWFKKMYYSDIGPHVRGQGGKVNTMCTYNLILTS